MAGASSREVSRHLNTLFHCGAAGQLGDAELLERFVAGRDEAAEAAFAALVERHGVMVLGVCRRVLGNRHEAEDAFQATFLVLAKKAASLTRREQLANWLHGVARRAALDLRARATRQKAREKRLGAKLPVDPPDPTLANELRAILDEELARLPERHRAAILLCELEGLSRREAALRLGISEGTLSSRLARARSSLRDRLTRRGFALSTATLACVLAQDAHAVILPPILLDSTIRVATLVAAGSSLAGVVSTSVATLTEGVMKAMLLAKLKYAFLGLFTFAVVSTSVGVVAQDAPDRVSDNDRLKAVERKLDKLLEVLGDSSSFSVVSRPSDPTPVPPKPPMPPLPDLGGAPALAPPSRDTRAVPPSMGGGGMINDMVGMRRMRGMGGIMTSQPDLAGRVDHLERRLSALEQRFSELERRLKSGLPKIETSRRGSTRSPHYQKDESDPFTREDADVSPKNSSDDTLPDDSVPRRRPGANSRSSDVLTPTTAPTPGAPVTATPGAPLALPADDAPAAVSAKPANTPDSID